MFSLSDGMVGFPFVLPALAGPRLDGFPKRHDI